MFLKHVNILTIQTLNNEYFKTNKYIKVYFAFPFLYNKTCRYDFDSEPEKHRTTHSFKRVSPWAYLHSFKLKTVSLPFGFLVFGIVLCQLFMAPFPYP